MAWFVIACRPAGINRNHSARARDFLLPVPIDRASLPGMNRFADQFSHPSAPSPVERLSALIAERGLAPGDRLPPERELIGLLGLRRSTLRHALDRLEREGRITRHVGRGTFLAEPGALPDNQPDDRPAADCARLGEALTPVRMMQARLCIEPALAREAAINASGQALQAMQGALARAEAAPDWAAYEAEDDALHRAIAEGADNLLLLDLFDRLNAVRRAVAWGNVVRATERPPADHPSFGQHRAIVAAIARRDGQAAHDLMRTHLGAVSARLFGPG